MNNMDASIELTTQTNHQLDRLILRNPRPRSQKAPIIRAALSFDRMWQLRMHNQQRTEPRQLRHRLTQVRLSDMLKLIDTRRHQETLKPARTARKHRRKLSRVSRHHPTPKTNVNKTLIARGS